MTSPPTDPPHPTSRPAGEPSNGPGRQPGRCGGRRRLRLLLACGLFGLPLVVATSAAWLDTVTIGGTDLTSGRLDLRLDGADTLSTTTLAMTAMVPGSSSAQVVSVGNNGTVPLRFSVTANLTGTDAAAYATAGALRLTVVPSGTRSVSGSDATCSGGTRPDPALTLTETTQQAAGPRATVAVSGSTSVCLEVTLTTTAPSTLQGKTARVAISVTGTTDLT